MTRPESKDRASVQHDAINVQDGEMKTIQRPLSGVPNKAHSIALKATLKFSGSRSRIPSATMLSTTNSTKKAIRPRTAVKRDLMTHNYSNEYLLGTVNSTTNKSQKKRKTSK